MRAFLINGAADATDFSAEIGRKTATLLRSQNWDVDLYNVWEKRLGYCLACGICGNKCPGICAQKDEGGTIVELSAECDLLVFLSNVTFGGYSSMARKAFERTLPNIHPLFLKSRGELHHRYRYRQSPSLLVLGWQEEACGEEALLFQKLAERNAVNFLSPRHASAVISGRPEPQVLEKRIAGILEEMYKNSWETTPILPFPKPDSGRFGDLSTPVAILSASNRRNSNSKAILEYAQKKMNEAGAKCITLDLASGGFLKGKKTVLIDTVRSVDRVLLVSSLYHDGLNYAATSALETLADHKTELSGKVFFSAVVHSGYPEPVHTRTALAVCRQFAHKMDWRWQGGLTAGSTSPIGGQSLEKAGFFSKNLRSGLDLAIQALAHGNPVPEDAVRMARKAPIPSLFFLWVANYMTRKNARKAGLMDIGARPYAKQP